jgi:tetratricopeptide (TPR) repeat protein
VQSSDRIGKTEQDDFLSVSMLDKIATAFDRQDYKTAAQLLKAFLKESPQNPWGHLYRGRLYEVSGKAAEAREVFQKLLRDVPNPKLSAQARRGLQRLDEQDAKQRAQAIADPRDTELGMLILEGIPSESRTAAAQAFAQILKIDAYTARMQFPSKGWKLFRTGAIGELKLYGNQLRQANIPAFWATLSEIQSLPIFQVKYFEEFEPAIAICENEKGQVGTLKFEWSEITQQVDGMLPIFEQVVDSSIKEEIQRQRKDETQDFARICDLHLPKRGCILRICDWTYQFDQGIDFGMDEDTIRLDQAINRLHWNRLMEFLRDQIPEKILYSEFTNFAETAIDFGVLLKRLPSIDLFGQEASLWNPAFNLYSGLAFIWGKPPKSPKFGGL